MEYKIKISDNKKLKLADELVYFAGKKDKDFLESIGVSYGNIQNLEKLFKKGESFSRKIPLYTDKIKNLYVVYVSSDKEGNRSDLYADEFRKINFEKGEKINVLAGNKDDLAILDGIILGKYKFDSYKSDEKNVLEIEMFTSEGNIKLLEKRFSELENIILAKNLGSEPSNILTPETFAKKIKNHKWKNTKVKIMDYEEIEKEGLNLIVAVGKGSQDKPKFAILERIVDKKVKTVGIVGKGVTFDTGGIQVKPGNAMFEMKGDMCGAAAVFATMINLDNEKDLNVNVIAAIPIVENKISGESFKPSDIYKSYSGKTVEIVHTDAEGRLILADGISYISKNYKLDQIFTIATLTGACIMALGFRYAGIMGTDSKIIAEFTENKFGSFDKYFGLPLDSYFMEKTKGDEADLSNLSEPVFAKTSLAGAFLANFVLNDEKFIHLDIAGPALNSYENVGVLNKGMTGFGVDSLTKYFRSL